MNEYLNRKMDEKLEEKWVFKPKEITKVVEESQSGFIKFLPEGEFKFFSDGKTRL